MGSETRLDEGRNSEHSWPWAQMAAIQRLALPSGEKFLLITVARFCQRRRRVCDASCRTLAAECSMGESTVRRLILNLARREYVRVKNRPGRSSALTVEWSTIFASRFSLSAHIERCNSFEDCADNERTPRSAGAGRASKVSDKGSLNKEKEIGDQSSRLMGRNKAVSDDLFRDLFQELKTEYSDLTITTFDWAVRRIQGRAKTVPVHRRFWEKSLRNFFDELRNETAAYFADEAERMLRDEVQLGEIADQLKWLAANSALRYTALDVEDAMQKAERRLRREASVQAELRLGRAG